jgi:transposase
MSKRKQFTAEQKVAIIRCHLVENVPVSELCDELGIHANQYCNWQKQLFENAGSVFERRPNKANENRRLIPLSGGKTGYGTDCCSSLDGPASRWAPLPRFGYATQTRITATKIGAMEP